jgi:hypothetical protein
MLDELRHYHYFKKSDSELAADEILNNIARKLWDEKGYNIVYLLGAVQQLKTLLSSGKDSFTKKELMVVLASTKKCDDVPDEIKSLIDKIAEEFEEKGE